MTAFLGERFLVSSLMANGYMTWYSFFSKNVGCNKVWKLLQGNFSREETIRGNMVHSGQKCLPRVAFLWSKMPMFQRVGMREGGEPLPQAFPYLILMIWRPCDLNLVIISSLAAKCQDFEIRGLQFHSIKWLKNRHPKFKVLAFWSHWRYHDQI